MTKISLKRFWSGDIVEVELSLIVIPLGNGDCKMKVVLRAIALLDDSFAKVSTFTFE